MTSRTILLSSILILALLFIFSCAPPRQQQGQPATDSTGIPELSDDVIRERINNAWVREVPSENVNAEPISWGFDPDEPKEITVVDKQVNGTRGTIVLDIKTGSSPRARNKKSLAGQIRTHWELRTGWVMRRWEIVETENISMKYKELLKPPEQNANTPADPSKP